MRINNLNWLIVEDALRDRNGHWFEYLQTFRDGLRAAGDHVVFLITSEADTEITEAFEARDILPPSIWHRTTQSASVSKKILRILSHAWKTRASVTEWLSKNAKPDVIFIPTVLPAHLLAWTWLVKTTLRQQPGRVLLFFPNLPIRLDAAGAPRWAGGATTRLMRLLFRWLTREVLGNKVLLGVETEAMRRALSALTGLPILYLPHPVHLPNESLPPDKGPVHVASYGAARHEKGSDLLQEALEGICREKGAQLPDTLFTYQWMGNFIDGQGQTIDVSKELSHEPSVRIIVHALNTEDYTRLLAETHLMILPYRLSSYDLRVSRVAVEALASGIPLVVTAGTTLEEQTNLYGAAVTFEDGDVDGLRTAILESLHNLADLRHRAAERKQDARAHFSVGHFRDRLLTVLP